MKALRIYIALVICSMTLFSCSTVMMSQNNVVDHSTANPKSGKKGPERAGLYQTNTLANWDRDDNGILSRTEFNDGMVNEGLFFQWDKDKSGYLSATEYAKGVYARMDLNGSGKISTEEYAMRNTVWGNQQDRNAPLLNDGMTCKQFEGAFTTNSNFAAWDTNKDAMLDINEMNSGAFATMDKNQDGSLGSTEFDGYLQSGKIPEVKMLGSIKL